MWAPWSAELEIARQEWAEGNRRARGRAEDAARYRALLAQVDAIADELRRRVGSVFTLAELADDTAAPTRGSREALAELPVEAHYPARAASRPTRVPPLRARRARLRALSTTRRTETGPPSRAGERAGVRAAARRDPRRRVFGAGLALGQALDDNPSPGGTQTSSERSSRSSCRRRGRR